MMVRCLLIDNSFSERRALSAVLEGFGFACESMGLHESVAALDNTHPDLVLMEARNEPEVHDVLRLVQLRADAGHAPVVILYAAQPTLDDVGLSISAGASDFLVKPFDAELLRFKLEQAGLLHRPAA